MNLAQKIGLVSFFLIILLSLIYAVHTVKVLQPSDSNRFTGTVGIQFNITDGNFVAANHDVNVSIAVSTNAQGAGAFGTYLVQDVNADTYCGGAANYADVNCTFTFDTTTVADGNYFVDINALTFTTSNTDDQNHVTDSSDNNFNIDNSAAGLTITSPTTRNVSLSTDTTTFTYSSSDSDIAKYWVQIDSGAIVDNGTNTSYSVTDLTEGGHVFKVHSMDNLDNNSTVSSINFDIVTPPSSGGPKCGDNVCSGAETAANCPGDCAPICGDGACTGTESVNTCPADCGPAAVCGNNVCDPEETFSNCPADCEAPKGQKVRETVLNREMKGKPTPDDIRRILGAAGASENAVERASEALGKATVQRNIEVVKETGDGGETFTTIIQLVVENTSGNRLENVRVVEEIPKSVLENAGNVKSAVPFTVLNPDPIVEFEFGSVEAGSSKSVKYSVDKELSESEIALFAPAFVSGFSEAVAASCAELNCNDNNPCTIDSCENARCFNTPKQDGESCGTGLVCSSGQCVESGSVTIAEEIPEDNTLIIIGAVIVILVLGAYFFYSKK